MTNKELGVLLELEFQEYFHARARWKHVARRARELLAAKRPEITRDEVLYFLGSR